MKVLLREDVDNLGYAGEVHKVADGYGRNYLIPRGLAIRATNRALKEAQQWRERAAARRAALRAEYESLAERIAGIHLEFEARAGESGKLYGSITMNDVTARLNEVLGTDIDRRKLMGEPLRQLGTHQVVVRLDGEFQPQVSVTIHGIGQEEEEEAEAGAEMVEAEGQEETAIDEAAEWAGDDEAGIEEETAE